VILESFGRRQQFGSTVNVAAFVMKKRIALKFKSAGQAITPEEFSLLTLVDQEVGASQAELVSKSLKDKTTVTRLVDSMVKKSLLKRKGIADDRRAVRLVLTQKGQQLREDADPLADEVFKKAQTGISKTDLEVTMRTLGLVLQNFQ